MVKPIFRVSQLVHWRVNFLNNTVKSLTLQEEETFGYSKWILYIKLPLKPYIGYKVKRTIKIIILDFPPSSQQLLLALSSKYIQTHSYLMTANTTSLAKTTAIFHPKIRKISLTDLLTATLDHLFPVPRLFSK